jgi:hypothetical protein
LPTKTIPPTKERAITITVSVKPNETREHAVTKVSVSTKLAQVKPTESVVLFSYDGTTAKAFVSDPQQQELPIGNSVPLAKAAGGN